MSDLQSMIFEELKSVSGRVQEIGERTIALSGALETLSERLSAQGQLNTQRFASLEDGHTGLKSQVTDLSKAVQTHADERLVTRTRLGMLALLGGGAGGVSLTKLWDLVAGKS